MDLTRGLGLARCLGHLACLRDCGLVAGRAHGRRVFYSLARPELMDLLSSVERLLAATGQRVALCPGYGTHAGGRRRGGGAGGRRAVRAGLHPCTHVAAMGRAGRRGVLIEGGVHLEELARVRVAALDKTGTITTNTPG